MPFEAYRHAFIAAAAAKLSEATGSPWTLDGLTVRGNGTVALVLAENHTDAYNHFDPHFVLNVDRPEDTTVVDCTAGFGETPEQVAKTAVDGWWSTTGTAVLELLVQNGEFGTHLADGDSAGVPGWHVIHGGIVGLFDAGELQAWTANGDVLARIAPALDGAVPRDHLVGVKLFFGSRKGGETSEVRVNGVHNVEASQALSALDWPRSADGTAYCRTFALLVGRTPSGE